MSYLVGIDAGHSMVTGGKCTPPLLADIKDKKGNVLKKKGDIIHEYEFNKKVAYALGDALKRCGIRITYSGFKDNSDTSLKARASHFNAMKVDLAVSCHFNASGCCLKFQDRIKGLLVLKTKGCSSKTVSLGNAIHKHLLADLKPEKDYGVVQDTQMCGFTLGILRQTKAPAILVEYGFMDYWKEAKRMLDVDFITLCAEGTAKGICEYLGVKYIALGVAKPTETTPSTLPKYVKIIAPVNFRSKPSWDDDAVTQELAVGTVLTVLDKVVVDGYPMYKTTYGYVTANEKWVKAVY